MRALAVALLCLVAAVHNSVVTPAEAAIIGDARRKDRRPAPEDEAHMAYLITASRINYQDERAALDSLEAMKRGQTSFIEAMRRQSEYNKRNSRNREPNYSGDLGLLSYDQLDTATANALFDIRVPISTTADKMIGPICSEEYGCSLYIVFSRYRRSFFSQAWLDADRFCLDNDLDFGQFLQGINSDDNRVFAARIWPDDIAHFQRLRIRQVQNDLKRMKDGDPSTEPPRGKRTPLNNAHLEEAKENMAERRRFFKYFVTKEIIKRKPEVQMMTIGEIIQSGWIDRAKVRRMGFEKYANEGVRRSSNNLLEDGRRLSPKEAREAKERAAMDAALREDTRRRAYEAELQRADAAARRAIEIKKGRAMPNADGSPLAIAPEPGYARRIHYGAPEPTAIEASHQDTETPNASSTASEVNTAVGESAASQCGGASADPSVPPSCAIGSARVGGGKTGDAAVEADDEATKAQRAAEEAVQRDAAERAERNRKAKEEKEAAERAQKEADELDEF